MTAYNALLKPQSVECVHMYKTLITRDEWNRLISNPKIVLDKIRAPLVIWGRMVDNPERAYNGLPRCTGDNIGSLYALQVDVDNGCRIEEFVKCFHRYKFELYTSYSYGVSKPGDRFRAIFPLKEPIETSWLVPPVKENLMKLFDMVDASCFDMAHWQCLPCISSKDAPYKYLQHNGELLSFALEDFGKLAREYKEEAHWKREISKADFCTNPHTNALKKAQQILDDAIEGTRNRTMYSVLRWLKDKVGCEESEIYDLNPPAGMDTEWVQMIVRLFK